MDARSPIQIRSNGSIVCGTMIWRFRGQLHVTVTAKATFAFMPEAPMRLVSPEELHAAEVHHGGDPRRSLWAASDLAPHRAKVDVVLTGHAHVPTGEPARPTAVRLALHRGQVILDKTIHVIATRGAAGALEAVPLIYERAFGGPGWDENPIGTGLAPGSPPPNLIDPGGSRRSKGFGPIAASSAARLLLLGSLDPRLLERPIVELPGDLDWSFFQTSPPDQRLDTLHGDEWLLLEGFHPSRPHVRSRLPGARCVVHVLGLPSAAARSITVIADGLSIDVDRQCCSVTFRGSFPVQGEDALAQIIISAGIGVAAPAPAPPAPAARRRMDKTLALEEKSAAQKAAPPLPFTPRAEAAPAPPASPQQPPPDPRMPMEETLPVEENSAAPKVASPFPLAPPDPFGTATSPRAASGTSAVAPAPIPGAPWSGVPATPPPPPMEETLGLSTAPLAPPAPAAPPEPSAAPEDSKPTPAPAAPPERPWSWAGVAEPAPPPAAPPAPSKPPPKPAVKSSLYGDFALKKK